MKTYSVELTTVMFAVNLRELEFAKWVAEMFRNEDVSISKFLLLLLRVL